MSVGPPRDPVRGRRPVKHATPKIIPATSKPRHHDHGDGAVKVMDFRWPGRRRTRSPRCDDHNVVGTRLHGSRAGAGHRCARSPTCTPGRLLYEMLTGQCLCRRGRPCFSTKLNGKTFRTTDPALPKALDEIIAKALVPTRRSATTRRDSSGPWTRPWPPRLRKALYGVFPRLKTR